MVLSIREYLVCTAFEFLRVIRKGGALEYVSTCTRAMHLVRQAHIYTEQGSDIVQSQISDLLLEYIPDFK